MLAYITKLYIMVARCVADGVIFGNATVKLLNEAKSPKKGFKELEIFT